ncbi:uncharacterized protein [Argopecten irradians]|uniref:uncharacterized protein n=1 Tax=Argopecten irradians TaxID=31199 RepID=UPI0037145580
MAKFSLCLLVISMIFCVSVQLVSGKSGCPPQQTGIAWGCAYQPHCFSDSGCGSGHICCPHICGDFCHDTSIVPVTHSPDCHTLSCLLGRKK